MVSLTSLATIHKEEAEHEHSAESGSSTSYGIDDSVKSIIQELAQLSIKPAAILRALRDRTTILPSIQQLNNYLKHLRNKRLFLYRMNF